MRKKYDLEVSKVKIFKPEMKPGENESDWMGRCIPYIMDEGKTREQAVGQCMGMFNKGKMEKFISSSSKFEYHTYFADDDYLINDIPIQKGQELHYVLGVVLEPDIVDATRTEETIGDIYSEDEVRKAAHFFLANYKGKGNDFMHSGEDDKKLKIVESYLTPAEMEIGGQKIKKGTWLMGTLILDNEIWSKVKKGEITGYSIGGKSNAKVETA